jgi:hypothetical protein
LVFEKNANFFDKNWEKSQIFVIITSTPGTNVTILEIFSPKNSAKTFAFCCSNYSCFFPKMWSWHWYLRKNAIFAKNWGKSETFVIITYIDPLEPAILQVHKNGYFKLKIVFFMPDTEKTFVFKKPPFSWDINQYKISWTTASRLSKTKWVIDPNRGLSL